MTVYAAEVDQIGEFAGKTISVPVVDAGIFPALIASMLFSEPWLAGVALAFFVPQAVLVAWFLRKVNLKVGERIKILRKTDDRGAWTSRQSQRLQFLLRGGGDASRRSPAHKIPSPGKSDDISGPGPDLSRAHLGSGRRQLYMVVLDQTRISTVVAFMTGLDRLAKR